MLQGRDLQSLKKFEKIDHHSNLTNIGIGVDPSILFRGNTSCILTPEVVAGPYYIDGQNVRQNITDGQRGVPMHLEMQFVNIKTCAPATSLMVDIWSANATGVYSGVVSDLNGVGKKDPSNIVSQNENLTPNIFCLILIGIRKRTFSEGSFRPTRMA